MSFFIWKSLFHLRSVFLYQILFLFAVHVFAVFMLLIECDDNNKPSQIYRHLESIISVEMINDSLNKVYH